MAMGESTIRQIVLASRPQGSPQPADFRLEEAAMPEAPPGGVLVRALYLSLDPYMRGRMDDREVLRQAGRGRRGHGRRSVAEVVASDIPDYAKGDIVLAPTGWRSMRPPTGRGCARSTPRSDPSPPASGSSGCRASPPSGSLNIGKPKPGETLVVAAASGAVGSLVGQLAKIKPVPRRSASPAAPRSAAT